VKAAGQRRDLDAAARLIDAAERPMVIFGGGCVRLRDEARAFLRKSGARSR
jgi:thiamine pyrophosphate-dependent acetolactate synthase large subunit-like protein